MSRPFPPELRALDISLRERDDADAPFLLDLYASVREAELAAAPWTADQKSAFLRSQFSLQGFHYARTFPDADFWLVEQTAAGGQRAPIGRFDLDRSSSIWRVIDLGFLAEWRGRGVGGALLRWVQAAARTAGAGGVDLHVLDTNPRAAALYARLGFRLEDTPDSPHRRMVWRP